jgi:hypothetical protein
VAHANSVQCLKTIQRARDSIANLFECFAHQRLYLVVVDHQHVYHFGSIPSWAAERAEIPASHGARLSALAAWFVPLVGGI